MKYDFKMGKSNKKYTCKTSWLALKSNYNSCLFVNTTSGIERAKGASYQY